MQTAVQSTARVPGTADGINKRRAGLVSTCASPALAFRLVLAPGYLCDQPAFRILQADHGPWANCCATHGDRPYPLGALPCCCMVYYETPSPTGEEGGRPAIISHIPSPTDSGRARPDATPCPPPGRLVAIGLASGPSPSRIITGIAAGAGRGPWGYGTRCTVPRTPALVPTPLPFYLVCSSEWGDRCPSRWMNERK